MKQFQHRIAATALALAGLLPAGLTGLVLTGVADTANAQGLFYKEVEKNGRIYVFNTSKKYKEWLVSNDMGIAITMIGQGPSGETVVAENETAMDLYNFKHDKPGYERPAPKAAAAPGPPTVLRWGTEGELKFGLLLQAWYIGDDSPLAIPTSTSTNSTLGNYIGANTFRLRRSEIKLNGKVNGAWAFEVMFDPAKAITTGSNTADGKILQDLAVTYTGFKGYEMSIGQKKIILGEEGIRSSSELDFPERSQISRAYTDRRETGFFFKGDVAEPVTVLASISEGNPSNVLSDTNDSLNGCVRVDLKLVPGLNFGGSGCYGDVNNSIAHLSRRRAGGHARFNGGSAFPLIVEAEYLSGGDGRAGAPDLRKDGFYGQALYAIANVIQVGGRYDVITNDKDAQDGTNGVPKSATGTQIKTWTFGVHWLPLGHDKYKNVSLKLDYFKVQQDGRLVNGKLADSYSEFLVAAQVAF
jgi:Phosphate-selective porin O and P